MARSPYSMRSVCTCSWLRGDGRSSGSRRHDKREWDWLQLSLSLSLPLPNLGPEETNETTDSRVVPVAGLPIAGRHLCELLRLRISRYT